MLAGFTSSRVDAEEGTLGVALPAALLQFVPRKGGAAVPTVTLDLREGREEGPGSSTCG
ncbi:MAG: hypothetical protein ACOZQL_32085 [Myxococcota bacterium]